MQEYIENIMIQLSGKTFHSTEQVNDFFREKLENVAKKRGEDIAKELETLIKTIPPGKEWHQYSQAEANAMKNYNNGIKDAMAIIQQEL